VGGLEAVKVIRVSNFDLETVPDVLVAGPGLEESFAKRVADAKNAGVEDGDPYFYRVVADHHILHVWEP
jgi:hypothetical protein